MIYLMLAEGFEEIEALTTLDVLRRANLPVESVSIEETLTVKGGHGITVSADRMLSDVAFDSIRMIILPGGQPGTRNLKASERLKDLLFFAKNQGALMAAICAAPTVYGSLGFLSGKRATCYPGNESELIGAKHEEADVVVDLPFITGKAAGVAVDFALELVKELIDEKTAEEVRKRLYYRV